MCAGRCSRRVGSVGSRQARVSGRGQTHGSVPAAGRGLSAGARGLAGARCRTSLPKTAFVSAAGTLRETLARFHREVRAGVSRKISTPCTGSVFGQRRPTEDTPLPPPGSRIPATIPPTPADVRTRAVPVEREVSPCAFRNPRRPCGAGNHRQLRPRRGRRTLPVRQEEENAQADDAA